jgi:ERCC4-type nuclease
MTYFTILSDTREQKPFEFESYNVDTRTETLDTGDYTLEAFCQYDEPRDSYMPWLAVERKAGQDFLKSITYNRDRFRDEITRADDWPKKMKVVVECPWDVFMEEKRFMQYRDVHPNQISGTVSAWEEHMNVEFLFFENRHEAEREAFDTLMTYHREYVV